MKTRIGTLYIAVVLTASFGILLIYIATTKMDLERSSTINQVSVKADYPEESKKARPQPITTTTTKRMQVGPISSVTIKSDSASVKRPTFSLVGKAHNDRQLISYIKKQLYPPSKLPYNLIDGNRKDFSQYEQTEGIKSIFHNKKNGFFIEVGAFDGETYSNSLYWEREHNWTGLLIEPDPENFKQILSKNRKAYSLQGCLCPTNVANMTQFLLGGPAGELAAKHSPDGFNVPCYPLYSIIAALQVPAIDFLSLDIEGWELIILKTLPFELVDIHVLMVEYNHIKEGFDVFRRFLESKGYEFIEQIILDAIFVKRGVKL